MKSNIIKINYLYLLQLLSNIRLIYLIKLGTCVCQRGKVHIYKTNKQINKNKIEVKMPKSLSTCMHPMDS